VWHVPSGETAGPALVHRGPVRAVAFSADSKLVATGSQDGVCRLWDVASGQPLGGAHHMGRVLSVAFRPDGKMLACGGEAPGKGLGLLQFPGQLHLRPVPAPLPGTPTQIALWTRVQTGFQLDSDQAVRRLDPAAWRAAREALTGPELLAVDDADAWHRREADECELTGQWFSALWHLDRLLQREPQQAQLLERAGQAHTALGHWQRAVDLLGKAIDRGVDGWQARRQRGLAYAQLGDAVRAEADLRAAVRLRPDHWLPRQDLGDFLAEKGDWAGAAEALAVKLSEAPATLQARYALLCRWRRDGEGHRRACAALVQTLGRLPRDPTSIPDAAAAAWALSLAPGAEVNPAETVGLTEQVIHGDALDSYPSARAVGASLFRAGRVPEAIDVFHKARTLNPQSPSTWLYLAMAYKLLGKEEQARRTLAEAATWIAQSRRKRDQPLGAGTVAGLGMLPWSSSGALLGGEPFKDSARAAPGLPAWNRLRWDERLGLLLVFQEAEQRVLGPGASEAFLVTALEVLRLLPNDAHAHHDLGIALYHKGDLRAAAAAFRRAADCDSKFTRAYALLGRTLEQLGELDQAIAAYGEAVRLQPKDARIHFLLGHALAAQGNLEATIASYRKAVELDSNFAEAHCNLGLCLVRKGDFAEALPLLQRGNQLGSRVPGWPHTSAAWVSECERLLKLQEQVEDVLRGKIKLEENARIDFAHLLLYKGRYVEAAGFYQELLRDRPELAQNLAAQERYNAACAASLAGCGRGKGAADAPTQARWRKQA
jgi:Flp pilus assembly protein TadD